jgi:hypothetical protein
VEQFNTYTNGLNFIEKNVPARITEALKSLLETRHLYQSITINLDDILSLIRGQKQRGFSFQLEKNFNEMIKSNWTVSGVKLNPEPEFVAAGLPIKIPDIKLFCIVCDRIEPFNFLSAEDFLQRSHYGKALYASHQILQVFIFSFLCQACKSIPEVFMIRRHGLKLTNSGRSPMEYVNVPSVIPKKIRPYYSGSMVAYQSGQTLAGIFMQRTLVEQWAQSQVSSPPAQVDQVLDKYMETLPADFKARFPSLRSLYSDLSADLHKAEGNPELFQKAAKEIGEHFDARRLFKLVDLG